MCWVFSPKMGPKEGKVTCFKLLEQSGSLTHLGLRVWGGTRPGSPSTAGCVFPPAAEPGWTFLGGTVFLFGMFLGCEIHVSSGQVVSTYRFPLTSPQILKSFGPFHCFFWEGSDSSGPRWQNQPEVASLPMGHHSPRAGEGSRGGLGFWPWHLPLGSSGAWLGGWYRSHRPLPF